MVTNFWKVKQTWTMIRKNFRIEIVEKAKFWQRFNMLCRSLPTMDVLHTRSWNCEITYQLFLLLANLCFQVVSDLLKTRILLHIRWWLEIFRKSSVTSFLTVSYVFYEYLYVLPLFLLKYGPLWHFTEAFHLYITSKLMKPHVLFFQNCSFICPSILVLNILFISWILLKILNLTAVPKRHFYRHFLYFPLLWCSNSIWIG